MELITIIVEGTTMNVVGCSEGMTGSVWMDDAPYPVMSLAGASAFFLPFPALY